MLHTTTDEYYAQPKLLLLEEKVKKLHQQHKTIVLVTGVFDIFHQEHLNFLKKAKMAGDFLVVGIESDIRVRMIKGENRPINTQQDRLQTIQQLLQVDEAFILPEQFSSSQDHEALISFIKPNILAVSSHTKHQDRKRALIEKYGGTLQVVHEHNPEVSTTNILASLHIEQEH